MTYIVGIRKPEHGFLTIISDIMVTKKFASGRIEKENTALKTGYLFEGCIYGLAGDATAGHKFLGLFKKSINCKDPIKDNFKKLSNLVSLEQWDAGTGFKILFGIRNPDPKFYILDSVCRELKPVEDCVCTMGSGKELLDPIVYQGHELSNSVIMKSLKANGTPIVYYPCFLALWLSELVLGFEKKQLEEIGVGGIFHYVYQDKKGEHSSMPMVTVLSRIENGKLIQSSYRTCLINGYLIVEDLKNNQHSIFTSEVERQDLAEKGLLNAEEVLQEAHKRARELPIYYFCGFATHDPSYRGFYTAHYSCNDKKVIDWDGSISSDFKDKIDKNLKISK